MTTAGKEWLSPYFKIRLEKLLGYSYNPVIRDMKFTIYHDHIYYVIEFYGYHFFLFIRSWAGGILRTTVTGTKDEAKWRAKLNERSLNLP